MKPKTITAIRMLLTGLLLWQVFIHAHWSVGLSLTLIFIAFEATGQIIEYISKKIK